MADDIRKKPVNTLSTIGADFRSFSKKLDRDRLVQPTQKEIEASIDYEARVGELRDLNQSALAKNPNEAYYSKLDSISESIARANDRVAKERELRSMRFEKEYSRRVSSYASEAGSIRRVSMLSQHPNTVQLANRLARSGVGYDAVQDHHLRATSDIERLREEIEVKSRDSTVPPQVIEQLGVNLNRAEQRRAVYSNVLRQQNKMGIDPDSRLDNLGRTDREVSQELARRNLKDQVGSGKSIMVDGTDVSSIHAAREKESELLKKFSEAMDKVNKELEQFGKATESNVKEAEKLKESLNTVQGVIKEQSSGGGGSFFSKLVPFAAPLAQGGTIMQAIAGGIREIGINQSNRYLGNQINAASQANSVYGMRKAALEGDMSALSILSSGALDAGTMEGNSMYRRTQTALGFQGVGQALTGAGAVAAAAPGAALQGGVGLLGGPAGAAAMTGLALTAAGAHQAVGMASTFSDMGQGISANAEMLNRRAQMMQLAQEMNLVNGDQRQQFYSYAMGARGAAIGGGAAGARFFNETAGEDMYGPTMMDRMVGSKMSPEQFTKLAAMGLRDQGSTFSSEQLFMSRGLERSGVMDASTSMSMMGRLASAGANNPSANMASVLESAFSKSLDSSKALSMVVEHTAAMAEQSRGGYAIGMDTTIEAAKLITSGVDMNDPNRERAARISATGSEALNNIATDTSVNLTAMANVSRLARKTGMSHQMARNITAMDNDTVATLYAQMQKDPNANSDESKRILANLRYNGYGGLVGKGGGFNKAAIEETVGNRALAMLQVGGVGLASGTGSGIETAQMRSLMDQIKKGSIKRDQTGNIDLEAVSKQFPQLAESIAIASPQSGISGGLRSIIGNVDTMFNPNRVGAGKGKADASILGEGGSESLKKADDLATAGATEMAKQAKFAADQLGGAAKALEKINVATQALADKFHTSKDGENFASAAAESAATFANKAADLFAQQAATKLGDYLNAQLRNAGRDVPAASPRTNTQKNMPGS